MNANEIRKNFEDRAYRGYVSSGIASSDGYYAPVITTIPARFVTGQDVTGSYARLMRDSDTAELV